MSVEHTETLDSAEQTFRQVYGAKTERLGREVPVLVALPMALALHFRGERRSHRFERPSFCTAKAVAHVAVALFTSSLESEGGAAPCIRHEALLTHAEAVLQASKGTTEGLIQQQVVLILEDCLAFAQKSPDAASRERFANSVGPKISQLTELATREQVAALHEATEAILNDLSAADRASLQIVVVGDHQARARSLGMQYFQRRVREPHAEECVIYGEHISGEDEALKLVGTRHLDRLIAKSFFGDEKRLQRDVLGDAAQRCLAEMAFEPIR